MLSLLKYIILCNSVSNVKVDFFQCYTLYIGKSYNKLQCLFQHIVLNNPFNNPFDFLLFVGSLIKVDLCEIVEKSKKERKKKESSL